MKNILLSTSILLGAASVAVAGTVTPVVVPAPSIVAPPAVTAAATDWSGFYAGAQLAYGGGVLGMEQGTGSLIEDGFGLDPFYGGFAGYNKQWGRFVVGGELAYAFGTYDNFNILDQAGSTTLKNLGDAKLRLGFAVGRALPYAALGYSWSKLEATTPVPESIDMRGVNLGLGLDFLVTERIFVGAELMSRGLVGTDAAGDSVVAASRTVNLRVGMKF
ncbi:MAG: porin family protein [Rhodobacteraceae bacterium]|nr:porin family protein [Paracoccaceae bacterium]